MNTQDTTDHILIDLDAESQRDLLGNAGTTPIGITPFHLNNGVDYLFLRSFGSLSMANSKIGIRRKVSFSRNNFVTM
jgi:hypothetical protein